MPIQKYKLTQAALVGLREEYDSLINTLRPKVIKEIQDARALGDISENADYDAAKNQQAFIDTRIAELEEIFDHHELISEKVGSTVVDVGTKVKILDKELNQEVEYEILGTIDNDPEKNKISNECPLAMAIIGKKVGDEVEILGIQNPYSVKILQIS